jgi:hypothetical protein
MDARRSLVNPLINPNASQIPVASADDIIEQIVVQCWMFEARGGERAGAYSRAEKTLERLLSRGLLSARSQDGELLLDPYAANNAIKSRVGDPADDAWADWQRTTRRNAISLPTAPHLYRLHLRREWHAFTAAPGRPLIFRLPLPLRGTQRGTAQVRLLEPAGALTDRRDGPGRVEIRLDSARVRGPVVADMAVEFVDCENRDDEEPSAPLGAAVGVEDEPWLRENEGVIAPSVAVKQLAAKLAEGQATARDLAHSAWDWLISNLRFGDVHRSDLDSSDPMGGLLHTRLADCALGSSLLVTICRARGVPARLLSGFLLHPANIGPHSWAEVRLAPGRWVPFDFGSWCYSAGDPRDPIWGNFFRGRVDARFIAEVAPREFTGWGSASPPERWFRLERLRGDRIEHTLHALPDGALLRRDQLALEILGPA